MTASAPVAPAWPARALALLLFAGSGASALIYEVVWFHQFRFVIGSSAVSMGFLLASFMGGMGFGSLLLPRLLRRNWHPLRVYALLELLIGVAGWALPRYLPDLGRLYFDSLGHGYAELLLRGGLCAAVLLLPTMCMGATLPAIARWLDTTPQGLAAMGRFYAANIVGAVAGTLLAGFWLLRVYDSEVATWVAIGGNALVAALALWLSWRHPFTPPAAVAAEPARERMLLPVPDASAAALPRGVLLAIAASGATALGAEVVWTRLLGLLLGASVYTFSLILAVFLVGLGIGSACGSWLVARTRTPRAWFAAAQALLPAAILFTHWMIVDRLPSLEPTLCLAKDCYEHAAWRLPWDAGRCLAALLPAPVLWGASFPLAIAATAAAARGARDPGRLVGGVAGANTLGAIFGALATSLWLLGVLGSQRSDQALAGTAAVTALWLVASSRSAAITRALAALVVLGLGAWSVQKVQEVPPGLLAFGRDIASWDKVLEYHYFGEGRESTVAVTDTGDALNFHVAGKVEASTGYTDMRLQRLLGHLPALAHGAPKSVLIVGCGAGITAGSFLVHPSVQRIVICELEPRVVEASRTHFADHNGGVLTDPRTEIVFDDARHFLATTSEKFDVITSDPIHPWVRGAAALYTLDYHRLVREHLNAGGIVTQWVPLYQTDEASVKSQIGTFCRAFPNATVWSSDKREKGYDVALMGGPQPLVVDVDAIQARLDAEAGLRGELQPYDLGDAVSLLRTLTARAEDLDAWLVDAQLNDDVSLRLQYLAGLVVDCYDEEKIFAGMQKHRRWPDGMFRGTPERLQPLRAVFAK